ncbi:2-oxoglutarate and iron-dependent oxygenase domain-containing protein [Sorangium sp. So ce590]|uniref:2-oxoglutarate and iron-dependent oxygenase domain-containing protein n=1 Tax=unclassified Sorangium TaxID=2621164 RepID=UPI003F5E71A7
MRARVASAVAAACETSGFLQVVGHGIPESMIAAMRAASDEFVALPLDRKLLVRPAHPGINRGYAARGTEALSYSLGIEAPSPDLFEALVLPQGRSAISSSNRGQLSGFVTRCDLRVPRRQGTGLPLRGPRGRGAPGRR